MKLTSILIVAIAACGGGSSKPPGDGGKIDAATGSDAPTSGTDAGLTATATATITVPGVPSGLVYNAGTKKLYVACKTATTVQTGAGIAVIDDVTNAVLSTIPYTSVAISLAANATTKKVYVANGDEVDVIDSTTDTIVAMVKNGPHENLSGLAVDEVHNKIYLVTSHDQTHADVWVMDGATNAIGATPYLVAISTTGLQHQAIAVDGATNKVFVIGLDPNFHAVVVTLDGTTGVVAATLNTTNGLGLRTGLASIGSGNAVATVLTPPTLKIVDPLPDVALPAGFSPTGITSISSSSLAGVLVTGFNTMGKPCSVLVRISQSSATITYGPFCNATEYYGTDGMYISEAIGNAESFPTGDEVYLTFAPDPSGGQMFGPAVVVKLTVTH